MPKDPALLGKMVQVVIANTGKHFLKGHIMEKSLVQLLPRPHPFPPGHVSGVQTWKQRTHISEDDNPRKRNGICDIWVLLATAIVIVVVLIFRIHQSLS